MRLLLIFSLIMAANCHAFAQADLEKALRQIAQKETDSWMKYDSITWQSLFVHDDKIFRTYTGFGFHSTQQGWDTIYKLYAQAFATPRTTPLSYRIETNRFVIRGSGDFAWMTFDQQIHAVAPDTFPSTHTTEMRTLQKIKGAWKIVSFSTIDSVSLLTASATQMEDMVNALGYVYLGQKKLTQAIQVFQLNVSMYPNAWNVHDSLGEAYAEDGKKEEAIKSYSKSIELNPKNTAGIDRLKKLREQ